MIVRILGEGQVSIAEDALDELNVLDDGLMSAVDGGDETEFHAALTALLAKVREIGVPLPDEQIVPSELILPSPDASLPEVRALLTEEGLIPG
ncbi:MAG TPA: hypothetical protein VMF13_00750 [Luteitalea sp.]|nr:hypothetical protein [Luteitalea sp.]